MVDILYKPLNQIIIRQQVKYSSAEALARAVLVQWGSMPVSLSWVDGLVFRITSPPFIMSELLAKEYVEGKLHVSILYADMPAFQPSIHAAEEKIQVPVLNESANMEAKAVVEWLKKNK